MQPMKNDPRKTHEPTEHSSDHSIEAWSRGTTPLSENLQHGISVGIQTGADRIFLLEQSDRDELLHREPRAKRLLKPAIRGKDISAWNLKETEVWILMAPTTEMNEHQFASEFPAVYSYLSERKSDLVNRPSGYANPVAPWYALTRPRSVAARMLEMPKIVYPAMARQIGFSFDSAGRSVINSAGFLPAGSWLLVLLNSTVVSWQLRRTCSKLADAYRLSVQNLSRVPIPKVSEERRNICGRLAEATLAVFATDLKSDFTHHPVREYFRQWSNGVAYELYFPELLRDAGIQLFPETSRLLNADLLDLPGESRVRELFRVFERAYHITSPIRSMLFAIPSIPALRVFEEQT